MSQLFGAPSSILQTPTQATAPTAISASIPQAPSFSSIKFTKIGQEPELLKRFSDSAPGSNGYGQEYRSPSPDPLNVPVPVPGRSGRPSLLQSLGGLGESDDISNMDVDQADASTIIAGRLPTNGQDSIEPRPQSQPHQQVTRAQYSSTGDRSAKSLSHSRKNSGNGPITPNISHSIPSHSNPNGLQTKLQNEGDSEMNYEHTAATPSPSLDLTYPSPTRFTSVAPAPPELPTLSATSTNHSVWSANTNNTSNLGWNGGPETAPETSLAERIASLTARLKPKPDSSRTSDSQVMNQAQVSSSHTSGPQGHAVHEPSNSNMFDDFRLTDSPSNHRHSLEVPDFTAPLHEHGGEVHAPPTPHSIADVPDVVDSHRVASPSNSLSDFDSMIASAKKNFEDITRASEEYKLLLARSEEAREQARTSRAENDLLHAELTKAKQSAVDLSSRLSSAYAKQKSLVAEVQALKGDLEGARRDKEIAQQEKKDTEEAAAKALDAANNVMNEFEEYKSRMDTGNHSQANGQEPERVLEPQAKARQDSNLRARLESEKEEAILRQQQIPRVQDAPTSSGNTNYMNVVTNPPPHDVFSPLRPTSPHTPPLPSASSESTPNIAIPPTASTPPAPSTSNVFRNLGLRRPDFSLSSGGNAGEVSLSQFPVHLSPQSQAANLRHLRESRLGSRSRSEEASMTQVKQEEEESAHVKREDEEEKFPDVPPATVQTEVVERIPSRPASAPKVSEATIPPPRHPSGMQLQMSHGMSTPVSPTSLPPRPSGPLPSLGQTPRAPGPDKVSPMITTTAPLATPSTMHPARFAVPGLPPVDVANILPPGTKRIPSSKLQPQVQNPSIGDGGWPSTSNKTSGPRLAPASVTNESVRPITTAPKELVTSRRQSDHFLPQSNLRLTPPAVVQRRRASDHYSPPPSPNSPPPIRSNRPLIRPRPEWNSYRPDEDGPLPKRQRQEIHQPRASYERPANSRHEPAGTQLPRNGPRTPPLPVAYPTRLPEPSHYQTPTSPSRADRYIPAHSNASNYGRPEYSEHQRRDRHDVHTPPSQDSAARNSTNEGRSMLSRMDDADYAHLPDSRAHQPRQQRSPPQDAAGSLLHRMSESARPARPRSPFNQPQSQRAQTQSRGSGQGKHTRGRGAGRGAAVGNSERQTLADRISGSSTLQDRLS